MTSAQRTQVLDNTIFTVDGLLSPSECAEWIAFAEDVGFASAPITTGRGFLMAPEVRNNTRVMFDDSQRASQLWTRLTPWLPEPRAHFRPIGLNERLRIYRYTQAQYFRWHYDGAYVRNRDERSFYTVMVYLNDDFEGGTTDFDVVANAFRITPKCGSALLFEHALRHQGAPVQRGTKYVLRSDLMYRRSTDDVAAGA